MTQSKNLILLGSFVCLTSCVHTSTSRTSTTSSTSANSSEGPKHNTDDDIVESLRQGNIRFTSHQRIHPRQDKARVLEQANSQAPGAILVSCSDSRVPPEVIFDHGLGDLFSVRTAGHALDVYTVASIEYAIEHLGSKVVVVMGHTSCGAVAAAMHTPAGKSTGSKNIDQLVKKIRPGLSPFDPADKELVQAERNNIAATIADLKLSSPLVRAELEKKHLTIVSALYFLKSGDVELW